MLAYFFLDLSVSVGLIPNAKCMMEFCQGHHSELFGMSVSRASWHQTSSRDVCLKKDCKIGGAFQHGKYVVSTSPCAGQRKK